MIHWEAEYLLGNREMGMGPVCLSLFVTFQSAIALIGMPADTYNTGTMIFYLYIGLSLAYVVGYFTVVPVMYPLHLTSVFQYLELRFQSTAVRLLGTCIGMLQTMLYMSVALLSPALALQAAAGLPLWVSVAIVGVIGTVYTAVGGIKSVVWVDSFQAVVVFIGMATVLIKGLNMVGGFSSIWDIANEGGRVIMDDIDPRSRHSLWSCVVGGCSMWMVNVFNQSAVQRISSLKTIKAASIVFLLNIPMIIVYGVVLILTGLLLYAYVITIGCDPFQAGIISNKNQMMPYYVIHVLDDMPGFAGLYMAMLFSGALSTVSSGINALAANTIEDLLARPLRGFRDTTVTLIAKVLVVVYGAVVIGLAYALKALPGPVTQMANTVFGAFGGPLVGMFVLGGALPYPNKYGAVLGGMTGFTVNMWLAVGGVLHGAPTPSLPPGPTHNCFPAANISTTTSPAADAYINITSPAADAYLTGTGSPLIAADVTDDVLITTERPFSIYDISYLWLGPVGLVSTFVSGLIFSFITGRTDKSKVDSRLIFPFCRKMLGMPQPLVHPDDQSNVIAMKHYRQAWESFKKRGMNQEVYIGDEPQEKGDHPSYPEAKHSQHDSFTGTGPMDANNAENKCLVQAPTIEKD